MQMTPSPQRTPDNTNAMRGSTLGQMHQGEHQVHLAHPGLTFFLKVVLFLNIFSFLVLWGLFALKNLFPPYEADFKWAIGAYFIFGVVYYAFAQFFFRFAKFVEKQAVSRALTQNRRYQWHSQYDTSRMTEEDLKKVPEAHKQPTASEALNAGSNFFRITGFLGLASLITWMLGLWAFFGGFLSSSHG